MDYNPLYTNGHYKEILYISPDHRRMTCTIIRRLATTITNMLASGQVENVAHLMTHAPETARTKYNSEQRRPQVI